MIHSALDTVDRGEKQADSFVIISFISSVLVLQVIFLSFSMIMLLIE